ncbi:MAG: efflux RND transporter periplasmic adaptor subunit [Paracoccaceae bacterium]
MRGARLALLLAALAGPGAAQTVTAVLEPARAVELRAAVPGRVAQIGVEEGAQVAQGEVLGAIDGEVQRARVDLARRAAEATGQLDLAQARVAEASGLHDRIARARAQGAARQWEVDAALQALRIAQAERGIAQEARARAEDQLALERAQLRQLELRAPFDATVLEVHAETGEVVDTRAVLVDLADLTRLAAVAFLPVARAGTLAPGDAVAVEVDDGTGPRSLSARVASVDPRIDPASRTVRVRLTLDNADGSLRPGATLSIPG